MKQFNQRKPEKAPMVKFHPGHLAEMEFSHDEPFGNDYIMISIGAPGVHPEALTIHRPLGITRLDDKDWVCTRTVDVHYTLTELKDPDEGKFTKIKDKILMDYYVSKDLLKLVGDRIHYPSDKVAGNTDRVSRYEEATSLLGKDRSSAQEKHKKEQEGKPKAEKFKYARTVYEFMPDDMKAYEKSLKENSNKDHDLKTKIKDSASKFETKGGASHKEPQIPVPFLKGKNKDAALVGVYNHIRQMFQEPSASGAPPPAAASSSSPGDPKDEEIRRLRDYITKIENESVASKATTDTFIAWFNSKPSDKPVVFKDLKSAVDPFLT